MNLKKKNILFPRFNKYITYLRDIFIWCLNALTLINTTRLGNIAEQTICITYCKHNNQLYKNILKCFLAILSLNKPLSQVCFTALWSLGDTLRLHVTTLKALCELSFNFIVWKAKHTKRGTLATSVHIFRCFFFVWLKFIILIY